jgi:putative two-component system response regulator
MQSRSDRTVLVVDDRPENVEVLDSILSGEYQVRFALSGEKALQVALESPPDLVLLDIMMPGMDGYTVCRALKEHPVTADVPVIFVTALEEEQDEARGLELGAVDYITKPVGRAVVLARVRTHIALHNQNRILEQRVQERTAQLEESQHEIIRRLGRAAEYKDNETGLHVLRMSHYTRLVAQSLELDDETVDLLFQAAPMHDVGKIGVPDRILLKPGPLDPDEWEAIKKHPAIGAAIIGQHDSPLLEMARTIALTHHEKWNGKGYPHGLAGEDIPLPGRIVAIADVFDALTSDRPYKNAWSFQDATDLIRRESGHHFDPVIVEAFLKVESEVRQIRDQWAEADGSPVTAY